MTTPLPTRPARIRFVPCPPDRRESMARLLQKFQVLGAAREPAQPIPPTAPEPCLAPCDA